MAKLPPPQLEQLLIFLTARLHPGRTIQPPLPAQAGRNVLDIAPVSGGEILHPPLPDEDLLGEMLEGRA